jgi:hypothetical protein
MPLATDTSDRLASILDIFRGGEGLMPETSETAVETEVGGTTSAIAAKPDGGYDLTYQPATRAATGAAPGTVALQNQLISMFGGSNGGIFNPRNIAGTNTLSVHAEGRAGDVMVGTGGVALGNQIRNYLVEKAAELGVQEVIFNHQRWTASKGWQPYRGQNPHTDHVHYSMTREAAGQVGSFTPGEPTATPDRPASTVDRLESILNIIRGGNPMSQATPGAATGGSAGGGASTATMATTGSKAAYQQYAQSILGEYGWGADQMPALIELVTRESGWNPNAQNPTSTAYGIFQFLDSTWGDYGEKTSDPKAQIRMGLAYIKSRYGSVSAALAHHRKNNWY